MFKCNSSICLSNILGKVSESEILSFYLNINQVPCVIPSPLRKDKNPSFGLYSPDGKKICYTDFATKEKGNLFDLLIKLWNCSYKEVINKIYKDISKFKINNTSIHNSLSSSTHNVHIAKKLEINLKCKVREWNQDDIDYWKAYGISLAWLKYAGVYPISHYMIYKHNKVYTFNADKLAYVYTEYKENKLKIKIYQPLNKKGFKWTSQFDKSIISLWSKIPETGDYLIICSSLKDALCMWSTTNIPCIAPQGEGYDLSKTAIKELKRRYKHIFICYDNDKAGIEDAIKLAEKTGFTNITLPQFKGGKDISDARKTMGEEQFKKFIKPLFTIKN